MWDGVLYTCTVCGLLPPFHRFGLLVLAEVLGWSLGFFKLTEIALALFLSMCRHHWFTREILFTCRPHWFTRESGYYTICGLPTFFSINLDFWFYWLTLNLTTVRLFLYCICMTNICIMVGCYKFRTLNCQIDMDSIAFDILDQLTPVLCYSHLICLWYLSWRWSLRFSLIMNMLNKLCASVFHFTTRYVSDLPHLFCICTKALEASAVPLNWMCAQQQLT
jgi:hypothetical protein